MSFELWPTDNRAFLTDSNVASSSQSSATEMSVDSPISNTASEVSLLSSSRSVTLVRIEDDDDDDDEEEYISPSSISSVVSVDDRLQDDLESINSDSMDGTARHSRASDHLQAPVNGSDVALDQIQRVAKRKNSEFIHESYTADCLKIKNLVQWLEYADFCYLDTKNQAVDLDQDAIDSNNNYAFYLMVGEEILYQAIANLSQSPRKFIKYIFGKKTRDPNNTRAQQCMRLSAMVQEKLELFVQIMVEWYDTSFGQMNNRGDDIGWSPCSLTYRLTLVLRYFAEMLSNLDNLYTSGRSIPRGVDRIPDVPLLELEDTEHDAFCPSRLKCEARFLCTTYGNDGMFLLWPDMPIGLYTQFQLHEQVANLSGAWNRLDPLRHEITALLDALELRLSELATLSWHRVINPNDVGPQKPLDMGHEFLIASATGGNYELTEQNDEEVQDNFAPVGVTDNRMYAVGPKYLAHMLGMIIPMRRSIMILKYHIVPLIRIENDRIRQELDMLTMMTFELLRPKARGPSPMTFQDFCDLAARQIRKHRDCINDEKFNVEIAAVIRWKQFPAGLNEQYACIRRNLFSKPKSDKQVETQCVPRPILSHQSDKWCELPLSTFERTPLFGQGAASLAFFLFVQNAAFVLQGHGEVDWLNEYLIQETQWDVLEQRLHIDPSPFIYQAGANLYLRRNLVLDFETRMNRSDEMNDIMIPMPNAIAAFVAWLMVMIVDVNCKYSAQQKSIDCTHWIKFMEEDVIGTYEKEHNLNSKHRANVAVDDMSSDSESDEDEYDNL